MGYRTKGLPASALLDIVQTPDGFIWIGSYLGLTRFDGVSFTTFNRSNTPELSDNTVSKLVVTSDTTLWLATRAKGLVSYKKGVFCKHESPIFDKEISTRNVFLFSPTQIWLTTNSAENYLFDIQQNTFSDVPFEALKKVRVFHLLNEGNGVYWITSSLNNIQRCQGRNCETFDASKGLPNNTIESIIKDKQGVLWVATAKGLVVIRKVFMGLDLGKSNFHLFALHHKIINLYLTKSSIVKNFRLCCQD